MIKVKLRQKIFQFENKKKTVVTAKCIVIVIFSFQNNNPLDFNGISHINLINKNSYFFFYSYIYDFTWFDNTIDIVPKGKRQTINCKKIQRSFNYIMVFH